ncbi:flavodoxin [Caulobacter sp. D4A]|uniref:flavodoxin n=1 Tax=unclassified Caulobacter TaxID=2648921 RepID=UPI000D7274E8|nr:MULTISPECIES: flavodoxin [unclassified Caulobacter]PXA84130.1 flavodoxin [Caulobacter sp. D4A]PXA94534.1 flavodoxin [Caulobacter sp. D5]
MQDQDPGMSRRTAFGASAAIVLAAGASACAAEDRVAGSHTLVAYFTRSGNTRVIAGQLHRELKADLFEILPAAPYPDDYEQTVEQARQERDAGVRPPLRTSVRSLAAYDTVFLCFPIWGETVPPIVRSFLAAHDLSGKTVRPVITHGGYGLGDSLAVLERLAPDASLTPTFSMEADQERRTMTQVRDWLGQIARA